MAAPAGAMDRHGSVTSVHVPKGVAETYNIFLGEPKIIRLINRDLVLSTNETRDFGLV